nr:MAG TPA: hypothetical protein [Caudoviricetes sp.]
MITSYSVKLGCCNILYLQNRSMKQNNQSDSFDNLVKR